MEFKLALVSDNSAQVVPVEAPNFRKAKRRALYAAKKSGLKVQAVSAADHAAAVLYRQQLLAQNAKPVAVVQNNDVPFWRQPISSRYEES